ncbi:MAG: DUF481 domain-containing protein [Opitutaceae bacterium]|nr:DUF481 domain-containing protein [Opitutaceae bacterium]
MIFVLWGGAGAIASTARDALAYPDGDRVHGVLVAEQGGVLVFKSDRFGELRVPSTLATVIKGTRVAAEPAPRSAPSPAPAPKTAAAAPAAATPKAPEPDSDEHESLWDRFTPAALAARLRTMFGPWRGRLSFSTETVTDSADRSTSSYEASLRRKWPADEVQLSGRFDYSETNDVATTDVLKLWGHWRHDFNPRLFAHYRPTAEWNRASRLRGLPNDYLLLQQEFGAGYQLLGRPGRKLRLGVSQNLFDTWNSAPAPEHVARGVVSSFEEAEVALPWRMTLSQRGVWYPAGDEADGWENRIDLNKKLTETLSTSLRHEIRRNNPDGTAPDFTRLKLLFGLDF